MKQKLRFLLTSLTLVVAFACHSATIDFETVNGTTPREGDLVTDQFSPYFGVHFTGLVTTNTTNTTVIVKRGWPEAAFNTTFGSDEIDPTDPRVNEIGDYFLTARADRDPRGFICLFDAPVSAVQFHVLDIDGREVVTLKAYAAAEDTNALVTRSFATGGSGLSTLASITASNQTQVFTRLDVTVTSTLQGHNSKVGFDNFTSDYVPTNMNPATLSLQLYPGILIKGIAGRPYRIEYADALDVAPTATNWHALTNLFLITSPYFYVDTGATNSPARFYRAVGLQ